MTNSLHFREKDGAAATVNPAAIDNPLLGTSVLGKEVDFQVGRGFCVLTLRNAENAERPDITRRATRDSNAPRL
jgi:hypothetical protein